jgi:hypothetical protein
VCAYCRHCQRKLRECSCPVCRLCWKRTPQCGCERCKRCLETLYGNCECLKCIPPKTGIFEHYKDECDCLTCRTCGGLRRDCRCAVCSKLCGSCKCRKCRGCETVLPVDFPSWKVRCLKCYVRTRV